MRLEPIDVVGSASLDRDVVGVGLVQFLAGPAFGELLEGRADVGHSGRIRLRCLEVAGEDHVYATPNALKPTELSPRCQLKQLLAQVTAPAVGQAAQLLGNEVTTRFRFLLGLAADKRDGSAAPSRRELAVPAPRAWGLLEHGSG